MKNPIYTSAQREISIAVIEMRPIDHVLVTGLSVDETVVRSEPAREAAVTPSIDVA
ncbi:hypothetical protein JRG42_12870 [Pseudomonas granadensis]|uniref:RadC-like JAB domain-containing protein n=1 Tax=Pseudomonas granadensis TaxID=1421430 RepID=A0ABX7GJR8_9PSED|nr:hypothetical protein [Pseudomonas granadensis]MBN6774820.1 hypothetical protein [Pseudomonas granadensis]MBN6805380.1 hypothetical protein [Pseudomonas granadensis]MBN6832846.1 hypothetical protein [Pseudomonas granadensis]MBN6839574.1 hypothetical protein [Pseudomonas granadensis]MBN6868949.1 hypothetical protein [Pseudomonas granadensis]